MDDSSKFFGWAEENTLVNKRLKHGIIFLSFAFWVAGGVFVALGGWIISQKFGFYNISNQAYVPGALFAALGCLVFVISMCGVLGALRENVCLLRTYKLFLISVLCFELFVGIAAFAFWPQVKKIVDYNIRLGIEKYTEDPLYQSLMDMLQRELECCGSLTVDDWDSNRYYICKKGGSYRSCGVPWSCCIDKYERNRQCGNKIRKKRSKVNLADKIHTIGCLDKAFEFMITKIYMIGGVSIACNIILIIFIHMIHRFIKQIKKQIRECNKAIEKYGWVLNSGKDEDDDALMGNSPPS